MLINSVKNTVDKIHRTRKSVLTALLRACSGIMLLAFPLLTPLQAAECNSDAFDQQFTVEQVISPTVFKLSDGRRLALANIYSPKINFQNDHQRKTLDALALLKQKLAPPASISIRFDKKTFNQYHYILAHAFFADGSSIQQWLLEQGLAFVDTQPPNLWSNDCYLITESTARQTRQGLWKLNQFADTEINPDTELGAGFYRLAGKVTRITNSSNTLWLHLSDTIAVRIEQEDRHYFKTGKPESLRSHRIIASGILFPHKSGYNLRIRHPSMLKIID